ncbi:MAG: uroporphyrinogen decarboxylase family protein [Candidatus Humimicrobiaceae bacterium]
MTRKNRVIAAIEFETPDRTPIWAFNKDQTNGDILSYELFPFHEGEVIKSEWGYIWENLGDGTIGQPKNPVVPSWDTLKDYIFPDPSSLDRFQGIDEFKNKSDNHFLIAELGISGFNTYLFLRGFINTMIDFQLRDNRALSLLDNIFYIESQVIKNASKYGFDAIHFADDWGMQKGLMISPQLWIEIFKPRYRKHFKSIHDLGMKIFFHSCGNITSIIPEFHDIGLDVMNISQPNVTDIDKVSNLLKGKQCFMVPISYQTVSITGKPIDIINEGRRLHNKLGTKRGGFIGYIEEYSIMGMSEENYKACWDAFEV